jgi:hypothetical protein
MFMMRILQRLCHSNRRIENFRASRPQQADDDYSHSLENSFDQVVASKALFLRAFCVQCGTWKCSHDEATFAIERFSQDGAREDCAVICELKNRRDKHGIYSGGNVCVSSLDGNQM